MWIIREPYGAHGTPIKCHKSRVGQMFVSSKDRKNLYRCPRSGHRHVLKTQFSRQFVIILHATNRNRKRKPKLRSLNFLQLRQLNAGSQVSVKFFAYTSRTREFSAMQLTEAKPIMAGPQTLNPLLPADKWASHDLAKVVSEISTVCLSHFGNNVGTVANFRVK